MEEATTKNFQWGIELADALAQSESWETDLWPPLMKSWARQRGEQEQDKVLERLLQSELQKPHVRTVAETLMTLVNEGDLSHGSGLLSKAQPDRHDSMGQPRRKRASFPHGGLVRQSDKPLRRDTG